MRTITFPVGPLQCNCTIVIGDDGDAVVIDPGDQGEAILARLQREGCTVRALLHTHAHVDHVGASRALALATGAPILLHADDQPLYDMVAVQASWIGIRPPEMKPVDRYLRHGEEVRAGELLLDVLHTPGHTPGSLTFRLRGEGEKLFTGDTLFAGSIGRTDLPGGSYEQIITSIHERLMPLPEELPVVAGHGPSTTIGRERRSNPFLR